MNKLKIFLFLLVCLISFSRCKKIIIEDYNFCSDNCKTFKCKVINSTTNVGLPDTKIRIAEYKARGFSIVGPNVIAYYTTNDNGEFTANIPSTDFSYYNLKIQLNIEPVFNTLAELSSYPDTVLIIRR